MFIEASRAKLNLVHGETRRALRRFRHDSSGGSMAFTASAMSVIMGMAGLGVDATHWYTTKRENQSIADTAAMSGIMAMSNGGSVSDAILAARETSDRNGFSHGVHGNVQVNVPPASGPTAGNSDFVEVIVEEQPSLLLSSFVLDGPVTIRARAVASLTGFGDHCLLALDETMDDAIEISGTADAEIGCGVASNSNSATAIGIYGNAHLQADPAQAYGDIYVASNATLTTTTPPQPHSQRLTDPYDGIALPAAAGGCSGNKAIKVQGPTILTPGDFCNGLDITSTANVTMQPGIYVINRGDFKVNGGATVTGDSVTIVLTAQDPTEVGNIRINGGATMALTAPGPDGHFPAIPGDPDHGKYPGLLFIQDPAAPSFQGGNLHTNLVAGGAAMELTGALYLPSREAAYTGGNDITDSCVQIVARKITIGGNAFVQNDPAACAAIGVASMTQTRVRVTE